MIVGIPHRGKNNMSDNELYPTMETHSNGRETSYITGGEIETPRDDSKQIDFI